MRFALNSSAQTFMFLVSFSEFFAAWRRRRTHGRTGARAIRCARSPERASPRATNDPDRAGHANRAVIDAPGILKVPRRKGAAVKFMALAALKAQHDPASEAASANAFSMRFK
jgi:hypothetical protein